MNHDLLREHCLSWPGVTEDFPFDPVVLALRVGGKIFALTSIDSRPMTINLKCDPERAVELRATYTAITPGWHMNKTHWNTVVVDGSLPSALVHELIRHSYDLVFASLSKRERAALTPSA